PKAELHVHFAGTLHFDTIQSLVSKYDVSGVDIDALYYRGDTYMNVLPALKVACDLLREPEDFAYAAYETQREAAENGIRYREMFWNPIRPIMKTWQVFLTVLPKTLSSQD
ncbi:MAG: hypothetical protein ACW968_12095, partial [Candidatus Thorarchaeota archaeon]